MKKFVYLLIIPAIYFNFCSSNKHQNSNEKGEDRLGVADTTSDPLIHLDISKSYSTKRIFIQDIADIEYVALERSGDNFFSGPIIAITQDKYIGYSTDKGTVFIFAKDGRIIKSFNHQGGGPQEYFRLNGLVYDILTDELFISDIKHMENSYV